MKPFWRGVGLSRPKAPIALQVVILMTGGLIVAQIVTVLVVVLAPPPRPQPHTMGDLVTAFEGGALQTRFGRPLVRTLERTPPVGSAETATIDERNRDDLATLLHIAPARVRFEYRGRRAMRRWAVAATGIWRGAGPGPPPGDQRPRDPPPAPGASPQDRPETRERDAREPGQWRGHGHSRDWRFGGLDRPVFSDFIAAVQGPDGRWTVVRPAPEPFPNDWQSRVLLWLVLSLALVAPIGYLFARRITAPLNAFAQAAERFGKDPNAPLMVLDGPAELGVAARAFNDMQARLKRYVEDRTAMVGAISHDLRTPLARIRFKLEAASPELRRTIATDVRQMEEMISAVLQFIRDAHAPRNREPLDLLSLVECVVDDAAMMGGDALVVDEVSATVEGDASALQRLFANLIDNALKYGGCAHISLRQQGQEAVIEIADHGPGLPDAELERVFQPFYRSDPARNLDAGGIGLGLAVARSIAREHGGDVRLSASPAGLVAHVHLPLSRMTLVRAEETPSEAAVAQPPVEGSSAAA